MMSISIPLDQECTSQIQSFLYEHSLSKVNLVCNTLLSAFLDPTLTSHINSWDTKIANGVHFCLLSEKLDQNTDKEA